jgi:hypothetical protein
MVASDARSIEEKRFSVLILPPKPVPVRVFIM